MKNWKLLFFLVIVAFVLFWFQFGLPWKVYEAHQESKAYLQDKYQEAFKVRMPRFWIMDGKYHAEASPVAKPDLKFSVGTDQWEEGITDNYVWMSWRYEGKQSIIPIFSPYYKENNIFVEVDPVPNLNQQVSSYKDAIKLEVTIDAKNREMTSIEAESTEIYRMIEMLREQQIPIKSLFIRYETKSINLLGNQLEKLENAKQLYDLWETNIW